MSMNNNQVTQDTLNQINQNNDNISLKIEEVKVREADINNISDADVSEKNNDENSKTKLEENERNLIKRDLKLSNIKRSSIDYGSNIKNNENNNNAIVPDLPYEIFIEESKIDSINNLLCSNCRGVCYYHILDCCQEAHLYCLQCFEYMKSLQKDNIAICNITNNKILYGNKISQIFSEVKKLKVRCINNKHGCEYIGYADDYCDNHLNICPKQMIICPSSNCGISGFRSDLETHIPTCPFRKVICDKCYSITCFYQTSEHLTNECPETIVKCDIGCGMDIKRKDSCSHRNSCSIKYIKCPYYDVGCRKLLKMKDYYEHLSSNIKEHNRLYLDEYNKNIKREALQDNCTSKTEGKNYVIEKTLNSLKESINEINNMRDRQYKIIKKLETALFENNYSLSNIHNSGRNEDNNEGSNKENQINNEHTNIINNISAIVKVNESYTNISNSSLKLDNIEKSFHNYETNKEKTTNSDNISDNYNDNNMKEEDFYIHKNSINNRNENETIGNSKNKTSKIKKYKARREKKIDPNFEINKNINYFMNKYNMKKEGEAEFVEFIGKKRNYNKSEDYFKKKEDKKIINFFNNRDKLVTDDIINTSKLNPQENNSKTEECTNTNKSVVVSKKADQYLNTKKPSCLPTNISNRSNKIIDASTKAKNKTNNKNNKFQSLIKLNYSDIFISLKNHEFNINDTTLKEGLEWKFEITNLHEHDFIGIGICNSQKVNNSNLYYIKRTINENSFIKRQIFLITEKSFQRNDSYMMDFKNITTIIFRLEKVEKHELENTYIEKYNKVLTNPFKIDKNAEYNYKMSFRTSNEVIGYIYLKGSENVGMKDNINIDSKDDIKKINFVPIVIKEIESVVKFTEIR